MKELLVILLAVVPFAFNARIHIDLHSVSDDAGAGRIFGGYLAKKGKFPYQAALRLNFTGEFEHNCGGSIITNRFIVTAAHCFSPDFPYDVTRYRIVLGAHNRTGDGELFKVANIFIHPEWNLTLIINDVGLVQTDRLIEFNQAIQPISIAKEFIGPAIRAITSGWGITDVSFISHIIDRQGWNTSNRPQSAVSHILQSFSFLFYFFVLFFLLRSHLHLHLQDQVTTLKYAYLFTMTNDECKDRYGHTPAPIHDGNSTLCAYSARVGTGVCNGDSGM